MVGCREAIFRADFTSLNWGANEFGDTSGINHINFVIGLCRKSIMYTLWSFPLFSTLKALMQIGFQLSCGVCGSVYLLYTALQNLQPQGLVTLVLCIYR